jgi:CheY-like chemotaxis protein
MAVVLVVDDDRHVRTVAVSIMEDLDAASAEAASGEEALAFLRDHAPEVRLIFTDFELPGRIDGLDLARTSLSRWPWIKVLVTSGDARVHDIPENVTLLPKPWRPADIRAYLRWEWDRAGVAGTANVGEAARQGGERSHRSGRFHSNAGASFRSQPSTMLSGTLRLYNGGRRTR